IALSQQLALVESQLQELAASTAMNQRRIETHKVTLSWVTAASSDETGEIREALGDFGDYVSISLAFVIRAVASLLPIFIVVVLPLYLLLRRWRRKRALRSETSRP